jgi:hypothetical protein
LVEAAALDYALSANFPIATPRWYVEARQLVDGGFLSFSIACSTENEPGRWRGGNS